MSTDWQNSLLFLEDGYTVDNTPGPTGIFLYRAINGGVPVDVGQTLDGYVISNKYVIADSINPASIGANGLPEPSFNRNKTLSFSAEYTGYYPVEIEGFNFIEVAPQELEGNATLQAKDCAEWAKFHPGETGEPPDPNYPDHEHPGLFVTSTQQLPNGDEVKRTKLVRTGTLNRIWFEDLVVNGVTHRFKPLLFPGERFEFAIVIAPPSSNRNEILSAERFDIRLDLVFAELNPRRQAQRGDDEFEVCVPVGGP